MTAPRWPDVYAGILALLPTLSGLAGVAIFDGQPISADTPVDWVTVGYAEASEDAAGSFQQARDDSGQAMQESGEIRCHFVASSGDTNPAGPRARAFAMVGALQMALEQDQTLGGVLGADSVVTLSCEVSQVQNSQGSAQSLTATLHYLVTTYY